MSRDDKRPKAVGGIPTRKKEPREAVAVGDEQFPVWRLGRIDFDGPWCPKSLAQDKLVEITTKLGQLETQTWPDLGRHGCHLVDVWKLIKPAQRRLRELKLDDIAQLYSLRLSGANRRGE